MSEELDYARQYRYENDSENYDSKVSFYDCNIAEIISCENEDADPGDAGGDIIEGESPMSHGADARHKRGKSADDGNEAGYDNGFSPVLFVKTMGSLKVFPVK